MKYRYLCKCIWKFRQICQWIWKLEGLDENCLTKLSNQKWEEKLTFEGFKNPKKVLSNLRINGRPRCSILSLIWWSMAGPTVQSDDFSSTKEALSCDFWCPLKMKNRFWRSDWENPLEDWENPCEESILSNSSSNPQKQICLYMIGQRYSVVNWIQESCARIFDLKFSKT